MPAQLDLYGVYMPSFFAIMVVAYIATLAIRFVAGRAGFYALVWHRALFDVALYVVILGAFFVLSLKYIQ
jgi:hypothetical protein